MAGEPLEHGFRLVQLLIAEARDRGTHASLGLEVPDVEDLALGFRFRTSREVFADALAVEPARERKTTAPEGLLNCEMTNELF